jgi:hypothetical protein
MKLVFPSLIDTGTDNRGHICRMRMGGGDRSDWHVVLCMWNWRDWETSTLELNQDQESDMKLGWLIRTRQGFNSKAWPHILVLHTFGPVYNLVFLGLFFLFIFWWILPLGLKQHTYDAQHSIHVSKPKIKWGLRDA